MTPSLSSLLRIPAWIILWLAVLEATVRVVWQPSVVGVDAYRETSASFGYGYDFLRPMCEREGDELVCVPTQYRPFALQRLPAVKDPAAFRIVTIGGSHAAGNRTTPYPQLALAQLRARCPTRRWEAANLGVPGFGSTRVRMVGTRALDLDPDVLVIDFDGSNEYEDLRDLGYRRQLHAGIWGILFRSQLVVLGRKYLSREYAMPSSLQRVPRGLEGIATRRAEVRQLWNAGVADNYERLIALTRDRGVEVVFVGLGTRGKRRNVAFQERHELMWSLADEHGVPVVDIGTLFAELPAKKRVRLFQRDKRHYNDRGHRLVARALADALERIATGGPPC
jgi:hypothetical protein